MRGQDVVAGPVPPRRGLRVLRTLAALLVLAVLAAVGPAPRLPSPALQPVSATDPVPPTDVTATAADRALVVSWTAPGEAFITRYDVFLDGASSPVTSSTTTTATISGLVNGRQYLVTVKTVTNFLGVTYVGTAASSPPAPGTPRDSVAPAAPTGVTAARGDGRVDVSWVANGADYDADGYRVLRDGVVASPILVGGATTGWTDTSVVNDTTYGYTVQTRDTSGNWSLSSSPVASATPTDLTAPAAPTGLVGGRGDGRAGLSWNANAEPDLASYRVLRNGVEIATVTATSHLDLGLTNDTTYSYTIVAVDTHGNRSPASAAVLVTPTDLTPPAAPIGLTAVRGDGQITLSWTANAEPDLASYRLLRDGVEVATVPSTSTGHVDTGLTNGTTYTYRLVAEDTHGNRSVSSSPAGATPADLGPPAVPTGLAAVRGDRQVDLSWTANPDADLANYRLMRDGLEIAVVPAGTTSHVDAGLTNDTTYSYTLAALDTSGNRSADSAPVTARPTDLTPPAAPTGLTAVRGDGRVTLSWTGNAEPDLANYRVLRDGTEVATVTGTTHVDTGLTNGTTYTYRLVAVDTHGNRSSASAAVLGTPADLTAPAPPTGLTALRGDGRVSLSWTANAEPDLASYRLMRDGVEIAVVAAGTTSHVDAGLTNDATYGYTLAAVDTSGNRSADSAPVAGTPTDLTAPATPSGIVVTKGSGQVTVSWTANAEPDLASYRVLRDGVEIATVTGTTYPDTAVNGVNRAYAVVAVDRHGNRSAPSAPVSSSDDTAPPAAPTGLTATRGDGSVGLAWTANPEPDLASYRVLRGGVEIATVTGTSYTDAGRTNGVPYTYTLVAVDTSGNRSAESAPASATPTDLTAPSAPTGLVATAGENQVTLSWAANPEPDLASYRVLRGGVEIATVIGTSYTDVGRTNGVTYTYTLVAVDGSGNRSAQSAPASATPVDGPPAAPTGVTAIPGDRRATLSWTAPPDPDVVGYRVRAEDGSTVATATAPTTSAPVAGLTNGVQYRFTVVAVDAGGNVSVASGSVSVTPASPAVPVTGAGESGGMAASTDGRYVVTGTKAQREASDTNTAYELYLLDRTAGTARRIAPLPASASGMSDPTNTAAPAISGDGRYVVLATTAALLAADTNGVLDIYRLDLTDGSRALVSVPVGGQVSASTAGTLVQPGTSVFATSPSVAISADGDLVLFYSARTDLVAGDTNGVVDVFAKRMSTGAVTRVSTTTAGGSIGGAATGPALALTPDGRFALFPAATGSGGTMLLYRKTLSGAGAGDLLLVSAVVVNGIPTQFAVYRDAGDIALSDDGRYVAFSTNARITTATPGSANSTGLAYRKDTDTGAVRAMGTGQQTVWEHKVALDPTGRYGFFSSAAAGITADDNGHT
ncbi:MAG: fibronectin type III domain-containing protein, partial [Actinomycetes bacterium]